MYCVRARTFSHVKRYCKVSIHECLHTCVCAIVLSVCVCVCGHSPLNDYYAVTLVSWIESLLCRFFHSPGDGKENRLHPLLSFNAEISPSFLTPEGEQALPHTHTSHSLTHTHSNTNTLAHQALHGTLHREGIYETSQSSDQKHSHDLLCDC